MADLKEIREIHEELLVKYNPVQLLKLKTKLLADDNHSTLQFHYELLKNRSVDTVYFSVRMFFANTHNKQLVTDFLKTCFSTETDKIAKGDIIQILGHMRQMDALILAEKNINDTSSEIRYKCIIVLGWMGTDKHFDILNEILKKDLDPINRGYAATAMRQIWYNYPKTKHTIIKLLKNALLIETEDVTLQCIIVTVQDILKKKLGLKESPHGEISGDVVVAKSNSLLALEKY